MARPILIFICFIVIVTSASALELSSPDLRDGKAMSTELLYPRCGGKNISPALHWRGIPQGTHSLALTLIDTSVHPFGWSHWIVVGIPPDITSLRRGAVAWPPGARSLKSNFGDSHYDGPCPPPGSGLHRYRLTVWALKTAPTIRPDERADMALAALEKESLASARLEVTIFAP